MRATRIVVIEHNLDVINPADWRRSISAPAAARTAARSSTPARVDGHIEARERIADGRRR